MWLKRVGRAVYALLSTGYALLWLHSCSIDMLLMGSWCSMLMLLLYALLLLLSWCVDAMGRIVPSLGGEPPATNRRHPPGLYVPHYAAYFRAIIAGIAVDVEVLRV